MRECAHASIALPNAPRSRSGFVSAAYSCTSLGTAMLCVVMLPTLLFAQPEHAQGATGMAPGRRLQLDSVNPRLKPGGWRLEEPLRHANRWTAPSGQTLHSFTTRTEPRFIFAYNPLDLDMDRMAKKGVLEPGLTLAWHDTTYKCCRDGQGIVVDVGGNFGW